jgi:hypothetical protein
MNYLFTISITIGIFVSCSKNNFNANQYSQKWKLVKMTGQIQNSETTGSEMEWQETYLFNPNGSFIKSRERDGNIIEICGLYRIGNLSDGDYYQLSYDSAYSIIGSCTHDTTESLWLISENKLIGTWSHCDDPGLEYERIE